MQVEEEEYQLKPMNCPFHCLMYKNAPRSYRDLPIRWAELGTVYRYERSGTLHGLFRVRGFTQDDGHIFCLPSQLEDEIVGVLDLTEEILNKFGFKKFDIMLSTRPVESVGNDEIWEKATSSLKGALHRKNWSFEVDEGGGAFYGPKIDIKIRDAIGRKWQCSTIQCDFNLPERFELEYAAATATSSDEVSAVDVVKKNRPIMVHRAIFGSLERFFGVLIENTEGNLYACCIFFSVLRSVSNNCYLLLKSIN
jgi:threonyl-tRNA synthetase